MQSVFVVKDVLKMYIICRSTMCQKTQCANCNCWRCPDDFIGARGGKVKQCVKCRNKDARQKKRPEVQQKRNERQRERKYYKKYRAKKRSEDETSYLQHNASVMKAWRDKNGAHLASWRTRSVTCRLGSIKHQAKKKKYFWADDMTTEACTFMMLSPCFYCGFQSDETVNGIDRMNNAVGYRLSNAVPCCKTCNFMKKCLDARTYVNRCSHISAVHGGTGMLHPTSWPDTTGCRYSQYLKRAKTKGWEFDLTEEEFKQMCTSPCHYCQRTITKSNTSGIDRIDSNIGYVYGNLAPCCSECNASKGTLTRDHFLETCRRVAARAPYLEISDMPICLRVITRRTAREDEM
jgi:hypothetical protein